MPALASFYDHSSLVSSLTYGNGSTKSYVYDDQQRIKQTYVDNTLTSLYNYDRLGNLVKYSDAKTGLTWNHEYDLIGRATRSDASDGRYIGYTYDSFNRLYTVKENVRGYELKTVYDYDDQCNYSEKSGLVTGLTMNNCRQFVYSYDKLNRLTSKTLLKSYGVKTTYSYLEGAGENTTTALIKSVNNDGELLEYAYDENGNITSVKKNGALLESYEYDALNQLTKVTRGSEVYTYTYDNAGNILSVKKNDTVIKDYGYTDSEWKDLLTLFNGQTITYDAIGNPLTYRDGMTMTWQSGRQLASINKDGLSATFVYDANGHRTQKTVNGVTTNYYWVGDRLQYMATGDDMYVFFYDDKGTPYGVFTLIDGVQEHLFYLYNAQGDVIAIIDDYAERVVNYEYSAWGELLSVTGSKADTVGVINPFRYRGYCYDTETGLYYLNSRYYDPVTQRFVNGDKYASSGTGIIGFNMFTYCLNDPILLADNSGTRPDVSGDLRKESSEQRWISLGYINSSIKGKPLPSYPKIIGGKIPQEKKKRTIWQEFVCMGKVVHAIITSGHYEFEVSHGIAGNIEVDGVGIDFGCKGSSATVILTEDGFDFQTYGPECYIETGVLDSQLGIHYENGEFQDIIRMDNPGVIEIYSTGVCILGGFKLSLGIDTNRLRKKICDIYE